MQLDFDSLAIVLPNAITTLEALVTWMNVRLMNVGLDMTTILVRGPSLVLMGLAFSAVRYSVRRACCVRIARAQLPWVQQPASGRGYGRQLVYVTSGSGNQRA